jgi:hypothetical protein
VHAEEKTINGVIYAVADLESTKKREIGYTATPIQNGRIEMLDGGPAWDESVPVNIFLSNQESISKTNEPTREMPMVQSYVDICINGCLELEALYRKVAGLFTQEFIATTRGWGKFWADDRIYPRRPGIYAPTASAIDKALQVGGVLHLRQLNDVR